MSRIAVLLTCFNRKNVTLRCLHRIHKLANYVDVFLVDDNSTDRTADVVSVVFPTVRVIKGSGELFWNRGMHLAWSIAAMGDYSHFLWLNDDVVLYQESFREILGSSAYCDHQAIISGIIESHDGKEILYGGSNNAKLLLLPNGSMQSIVNMNGNVVLVPAAVFSKLGNLDATFHHDLGDVDYGLRARALGIKVLTSRIAVGSCDRNKTCRVRLWNSNIRDRFKRLYSPLGSHPRINFYFRRKHYGTFNAVIFYAFIHVLNFLPDRLVLLLFGNKYVSF